MLHPLFHQRDTLCNYILQNLILRIKNGRAAVAGLVGGVGPKR